MLLPHNIFEIFSILKNLDTNLKSKENKTKESILNKGHVRSIYGHGENFASNQKCTIVFVGVCGFILTAFTLICTFKN